MSAYLDVDSGGKTAQHSAPVTLRGRPTMLAWFEDVQVRTFVSRRLTDHVGDRCEVCIFVTIEQNGDSITISVAKLAFSCAMLYLH